MDIDRATLIRETWREKKALWRPEYGDKYSVAVMTPVAVISRGMEGPVPHAHSNVLHYYRTPFTLGNHPGYRIICEGMVLESGLV